MIKNTKEDPNNMEIQQDPLIKEIDDAIEDILNYLEYSDAPMENNVFDIDQKLAAMKVRVKALNKVNVDRANKAEALAGALITANKVAVEEYRKLIDSF